MTGSFTLIQRVSFVDLRLGFREDSVLERPINPVTKSDLVVVIVGNLCTIFTFKTRVLSLSDHAGSL